MAYLPRKISEIDLQQYVTIIYFPVLVSLAWNTILVGVVMFTILKEFSICPVVAMYISIESHIFPATLSMLNLGW